MRYVRKRVFLALALCALLHRPSGALAPEVLPMMTVLEVAPNLHEVSCHCGYRRRAVAEAVDDLIRTHIWLHEQTEERNICQRCHAHEIQPRRTLCEGCEELEYELRNEESEPMEEEP